MTAPVSLAEIKGWARRLAPEHCDLHECEKCEKGRAVLALVELAESYLEWAALAPFDSKLNAACARLAMAAKGLRP